MAQQITADPSGRGRRLAIAVSRFTESISGKLLEGARQALLDAGTAEADIVVVWVPGSFELPLACRWLAESGRFDAVIALGAVIRGATSHYEHVCEQAARGVLDVGCSTSIPVAFGVLTCENRAQALERVADDNNKGGDAARAALEMVAVKEAIGAL